MTGAEKDLLLSTARETIRARLESRDPLYSEPSQSLCMPRALFVTLRSQGRLRGCIGTLEASAALFESVKDLAVSSAFHDPRFPPLRREEMDGLNIEISVLSPLEKISSLEEIEVGKHGLYAKMGTRSGVLLPQVPVEQRWNRTQFLQHTCRKAGLPPDAWQKGEVDFYSFTAEVFGEEE
jgi:AmmeMemoRadiSam system protein A